MRFEHPSFLFLLFFTLIPIILYFFNLQKVIKVDFSGVELLEDLKKKTSKRFELKRLLIMLSRVFFIIFLVLAFAQPNFKNKILGNKHHLVFLDNSLSMTRNLGSDQLLDKAKMVLASSIKGQKGDKYSLITTDNWKINEDFYSEKDFLKALTKVEASNSATSLKQITSLLRRRKTDLLKSTYLVSDFQASIFDKEELNNILIDSTDRLVLSCLEADQANTYIDSAWLDSKYVVAGNQTTLNFSLVNVQSDKTEYLVKCTLDGNQLASKVIKVEKNSKENAFLNIQLPKAGYNAIKLELEENKVTFDKTFHLVIDANKNVKILIVKGNEFSYYEKAYQNEALFLVKTYLENRINSSELLSYDLIVLDGLRDIKNAPLNQLKDFVTKGGQILLSPSETTTAEDLEYFTKEIGFNTRIIEQSSKEKETLDFSDVSKNEWFQKDFINTNQKTQSLDFEAKFSMVGAEKLLKSRKGNALLSSLSNFRDAKIYLNSCPLQKSKTNFMEHALFVVCNYELAMHSAATNQNLAYEISDQNLIVRNLVLDKSKQYSLIGESATFVPEQQIIGNDLVLKLSQNEKAGFYKISADNESIGLIGINSNRKESLFEPLDLSSLNNNDNIEVQTWDASQKYLAESEKSGFGKWKLWVLLALLCLLAETALIRFYK